MKARPTGITIIAFFYIILGLFYLILGVSYLGINAMTSLSQSIFGTSIIPNSANTTNAIIITLTAAVQLAVGLGLFGMKKWAWYLALIGIGLSVLQGIGGIAGGGLFALVCGGAGLIIPVIVLIYLLTQNIRSAFDI